MKKYFRSHAGAVSYFLVAILVPLSVVVGFNFRIVRIAKYHQVRFYQCCKNAKLLSQHDV